MSTISTCCWQIPYKAREICSVRLYCFCFIVEFGERSEVICLALQRVTMFSEQRGNVRTGPDWRRIAGHSGTNDSSGTSWSAVVRTFAVSLGPAGRKSSSEFLDLSSSGNSVKYMRLIGKNMCIFTLKLRETGFMGLKNSKKVNAFSFRIYRGWSLPEIK